MPTLPNMGLTTPTLGGDSGTWDDKINVSFGLVDAHDHTSGKGVLVPVAGLNINADFVMAGFAVTQIGSLGFNSVTPLAAGSKRLFVSSADNELYWRTNAGTNVKVTDGTSLNISLLGGIGGDYSSVNASLDYSDADKVYTHKQETNAWARLASGPVRIYEFNTTESVYVELAAPAGLAGSYTATWMTALPATQVALQINNTGAISASNTFADPIEAPAFNTTSPQTYSIPGSSAADGGGAHTRKLSPAGIMIGFTIAASTSEVSYPIELPVGLSIVGYTLYVDKQTNNTNTIASRIYSFNSATGAETPEAAGDTDATNAPGLTTLSETGIEVPIVAGRQYQLVFTPGGGVTPTADVTLHCEILAQAVI